MKIDILPALEAFSAAPRAGHAAALVSTYYYDSHQAEPD